MILYTLEHLFVYFIWPYVVFLVTVCLLSILLGYITYKTKSNTLTKPFSSILKKAIKPAIAIFIVPIILLIVSYFLLPQADDYLWNNYWRIDNYFRNIENWFYHHELIVMLLFSLLISLLLLAAYLQQLDTRLTRKRLFVYLVISIPLQLGVLYIITASHFSLITIIILIGLPGALFMFL